jgi:hypothetical protein
MALQIIATASNHNKVTDFSGLLLSQRKFFIFVASEVAKKR